MDAGENFFLRNVIGEYMTVLGDKSEKVVVVNADLSGTCRNGGFVRKYPNRSFNVGIAEQNLISFSAGLAHEGFKAYAFTMAPFASMRACEQCRTDVAYANVDVRIVAPYSGVSGGISGATHWGMEDVAIFNAMPKMCILEPCDPTQAQKMLDYTLVHDGPVYIRTTVEPVFPVYGEDYQFIPGRADIPVDGSDGAFIVSGITVKYAIEAASIIKKKTCKNIRVVDMHTIKPIDKQAILDAARTGRIIVAHDHSVVGGLGNIVASVLVESGVSVNYKNLGIPDEFMAMAHAPYLYNQFKIDSVGLAEEMIKMLSV